MFKWMFILIMGIMLYSCTSYSGNSQTPVSIDETDSDYIRLKNAPFFACGGVGVTGEIPQEIHAFGKLLQKENAVHYFNRLEEEANNAGKLYALCGLYFLDNDNYANLMERYCANDETVSYMSGCEWIEDYPINEIIKREDNAKTSYTEDFYGGSIPNKVREISEDLPEGETRNPNQ